MPSAFLKQINCKTRSSRNLVLLPPPPVSNVPVTHAPSAKLADIKGLIGKKVTTSGQVYGVKDIGSMVLVNLGAAYPSQLLTVVLKGDAKQLASQIEGKKVTVEGTVIDYKGKPEIVITKLNDLIIQK